MALPATRMEFRIALSHVDRGVDVQQTVIAARHPSETIERLVLRVLAWCLLYEERLAFGPGLSTPDTPDLWAHDLTGCVTTWIECGTASAERLAKVVHHQRDAVVHVVVRGEKRLGELLADIAALPRVPKGIANVTLWSIDPTLVDALAQSEERRQTWSVTVVDDHFYVEARGQMSEGAVVRRAALGG